MLTPDQIKQAARIRYMAESVKAEDIRPISAKASLTIVMFRMIMLMNSGRHYQGEYLY